VIVAIRHEAVEKRRFDPRQSEARIGVRSGPIEHRHPEHVPAQNAKRDQITQPRNRSQKTRDLLAVENGRELLRRLAGDEPLERRPLAQCDAVKEAQGSGDLIDVRPGIFWLHPVQRECPDFCVRSSRI
jgi:hypothetical protein